MTIGSQVKTCYASIKSIEATLNVLRNQTSESEARNIYQQTESIIREVKHDLEKQILLLAREEPQYNQ